MGFPPIPERVPKSVENRTFCALFTQKVRFSTLFGTLSGISGNHPKFCRISNLFCNRFVLFFQVDAECSCYNCKLIPKHDFCIEFLCNNLGRDGKLWTVTILLLMVGQSWSKHGQKFRTTTLQMCGVNYLSVFLCQGRREVCREIFRVLHFPGFGCPNRRISQTFHTKNSVKNGKVHAIVTLLGAALTKLRFNLGRN